MKFTEFLKDYLYDNYGLLLRAITVSLVFTILPPSPAWMHTFGENAICFIVCFATYCAVDILFELIKNCKSNQNSDNPQSERR